MMHSSFEGGIRTCAIVKIATFAFILSFQFPVFVAKYGELLVLSTCFCYISITRHETKRGASTHKLVYRHTNNGVSAHQMSIFQ